MSTPKKSAFSLFNVQKNIEEENYWRKELAGGDLPDTNLPILGFRTTQIETKILEFAVPDELTAQLVKMSKNSELSLYLILLAALKCVLYRYTGQEESIVGSPVYQPTITENTHNNLFLIRTLLVDKSSFKEVLLQVKDKVLKAYEHQDYPFSELLRTLGINKHKIHSPRILCLLQNIHEINSLAGVVRDVTFAFRYENATIRCQVSYHALLFKKELIQQFSEHFLKLLETVVADINASFSQTKLLSRSEEHRLLAEFNHTETQYASDNTLVSLFEEQVVKTPDVTAIICQERQLTYQVLNEKANQLAHYLRNRHHIQPNDAIGIMLNHSEWMVIGVLGVLKASGCYVPIVPNYPKAILLIILSMIPYKYKDI